MFGGLIIPFITLLKWLIPINYILGYVDLHYVFKDEIKKIRGTWNVKKNAPIYNRVKEENILKLKKVTEMLSKYQINSLKDRICKVVLREQKLSQLNDYTWELSQVEKISIIISEFKYKKYNKMNVIVVLNKGIKINSESDIYGLNLTKEQSLKIGGTDSIEF